MCLMYKVGVRTRLQIRHSRRDLIGPVGKRTGDERGVFRAMRINGGLGDAENSAAAKVGVGLAGAIPLL